MLLLEDVEDMPMLSDRYQIHWRDYFEAWRILYISELCDTWPCAPLLSLTVGSKIQYRVVRRAD